MLIRSQDREKLYPLTHGLYIYGNTVNMDLGFSADGNTGDVLLGEYETEARCLEILDEIQAEFQYVRNVTDNQGAVHFVYDPPKVYQMPEK